MRANSAERARLLQRLPKDQWLEPDLSAPSATMYGEGVDQARLHELVDEGVAEAVVLYRCALCPTCDSHQCVVSEQCARCQSANLKAIPLFHHILCAGIFEAPKGLDAIGSCAKCGDEISAQSDRVEPVGETYLCLECHNRSPEPALHFLCLGCHDYHAFDAVTFHRLWGFKRKGPEASEPRARSAHG